MIKQNIKIAIISIICFITFWLVMFNFIKIDKSSIATITFTESIPIIKLDSDIGAYIDNKGINEIKVEFDKQYFDCGISYIDTQPDCWRYSIFVPEKVFKSQTDIITNIIVDRQNLYQHWFKK